MNYQPPRPFGQREHLDMFAPGDVVRCIGRYGRDILLLDTHYTIASRSPLGYYTLKELGDGHAFQHYCFELVARALPTEAPAAKPAEPTDVKQSIAAEALKIVNGARRGAYGTPERNFDRIAKLMTAFLEGGGKLASGHMITASDVSALMICVKMGRLIETPAHRDSFVDMLGYAMTWAEVAGVTE